MKCEICNNEKEYFGCIFKLRNKTKFMDKFYMCFKHVPYSKFSIISEEI